MALKLIFALLIYSIGYSQDDFDQLGQGFEDYIDLSAQTIQDDETDSPDIPDLSISQPSFMGSGCTQNTATSVLSPDQKVLSVIFDDFTVEAGGDGESTNRRQCRVIVPVNIPGGYQVAVSRIDFRGFSSTPALTKSLIATTFYNSDSDGRSKKNEKIFSGPSETNFYLSSGLAIRPLWSECGKDFNFNIDAVIAAKTNEDREPVLITLDSMDMGPTGAIYHLVWRTCGNGPRKVDPEFRRQKRLERMQRHAQKTREIERRRDRHRQEVRQRVEKRKKDHEDRRKRPRGNGIRAQRYR